MCNFLKQRISKVQPGSPNVSTLRSLCSTEENKGTVVFNSLHLWLWASWFFRFFEQKEKGETEELIDWRRKSRFSLWYSSHLFVRSPNSAYLPWPPFSTSNRCVAPIQSWLSGTIRWQICTRRSFGTSSLLSLNSSSLWLCFRQVINILKLLLMAIWCLGSKLVP